MARQKYLPVSVLRLNLLLLTLSPEFSLTALLCQLEHYHLLVIQENVLGAVAHGTRMVFRT